MLKLLSSILILSQLGQAGAQEVFTNDSRLQSLQALQSPQEAAEEPVALGFVSRRVNFQWDRIIPLDISVDGLQIKNIFFNKRKMSKGPLKGTTFGTRGRVEVENTSAHSKNSGYAVAVFDEKDNLLGVATGGNTLGVVKAGKTATFELNFNQVKERLQRGSYFIISVELVD
jgi:hypothetical protein